MAAAVHKAAGFSMSKQATSSPRCMWKASSRLRHSSSPPTKPQAPRSQRVMPLKVNLAHHPLHAFGVVIDLGHIFPQDPAGYVPRRGRTTTAQELHEHQGMVNVAHAHAFRDGVT